ncbi:MAG TPA: purine-nucleoside phosphorylase [Clostridiales bacterium]|jgi:purine-nucleoside phosphorylase|nr:purine-nucleoside phosphorylase [Clostridiales bacterium]
MPDKPYPTPHINAAPGDIAKTVLMPGDPLRSRFIAENFLENPVLFNNVRGVQGYTGTYRGARVSVMASGMGIPSMGIYSHELFSIFGVKNIIRVGSAGSMREDVRIRDIVLAMGACTNSNFASQFGLPGSFAPLADFGLLCLAAELAGRTGVRYHVGNILSSDIFYDDNPDSHVRWRRLGVMAVEMEAAGLYMTAAKTGGRALAICTISDSLITREATTAEERQTSFTQMIELALDVAAALEENKNEE